jgi:2-polyprenyl-6-methoxyphenol hydroxylase-like FAD-dependent oxidoreductase
MARRIAVIGSGIVGLVAAHGLRKQGHAVTLYSDRSPEDWLHRSSPTGGAGRFHGALELERSLGLAHWDDRTPGVRGVHVTLSASRTNRILTVIARIAHDGQAIDMRMQCHRWMGDLEDRGGQVVVAPVDPERLDAIAADVDLCLVAVGRGPLCELFPRDAARSLRSAPPRELAMAVVRGPGEVPGVPFRPVKFNISPDDGEAFWTPYLHKDGDLTWALLVEAIPGTGWDRFRDATTGAEVVDRMKALIRDRMPWDHPWVESAVLADDRGWLVGRVLPSIRGPVARLPSGAVAMALGDTAMSLDPCAGQGANNGMRMVAHLLGAVAARGDQPFDAGWMEATFADFYADSGAATYLFSDVMTRPPAPAAQDLFTAAYGSTGTGDAVEQRVADAIANNFIDPRAITDCFLDREKARALIADLTGRSARRHLLQRTLAIGVQQVRQRLGLAPNHP